MAQKLMSENKDNPFNSRFFQPSDALSPPRYTGLLLPIERDMFGEKGNFEFATPRFVTDAISGINKFGQAMRGQLSPKEIQKLAFDTSLNVTGGTLLGSKLIKGAVPRDALAMGLSGGGGQKIPLDAAIKRFQQGSAKTKDYDEFVTTQGEYIQKEMQKAFDFSKNIPDPKNKRNYLDKTIREIENELTNRFSSSKATKTKDNVVELDFQKKKIEAELNKKDAPRDTSSGHAADGVPAQFGPPAHDMNLRISEEFTPEGFGTFSTDVGNNYENLKFFISSSRGTPQFKEEVDFYRKLFAIKGNPDAEITVYRASPTNDLRPGDLVTPIKSDAQFLVDESKITQSDIIKSQRQARKDSETIDLREEKNLRTMEDLMSMLPIKENTPSKLFEYKVKAKDIRWDGNNGLIRWGYFPDKS